MATIDLDQLTDIIAKAAAQEVLPRFRQLADDEVLTKRNAEGKEEIVTVADRAMEARLARDLTALLPNSVVVGEEGVSLDPTRLETLSASGLAWIVDPIDGTSNFSRGIERFGTMVCLVENHEAIAGVIYVPCAGQMWSAQRGEGVMLNGRAFDPGENGALRTEAKHDRGASAMGVLHLPADDAQLCAHAKTIDPRVVKPVPSHWCAATEYVSLLTGELDFLLYSRIMPWDHAAGVFLLREMGGNARFFDGREYTHAIHRGLLLAVREPARFAIVRNALDVPGRKADIPLE
ncbi:MAG: inositol monophosphatase [Deltaproteobacteria bacterium]|nr:inositol monophosphatase [Deltaproteobacteria bacterium]